MQKSENLIKVTGRVLYINITTKTMAILFFVLKRTHMKQSMLSVIVTVFSKAIILLCMVDG